MIDRPARDRLALLLRRFAIGRITNDDFEHSPPQHSDDPAIDAIRNRAWQFYDDIRVYRFVGDDRLTPEVRREFVRWIAFLRSDRPYEWPPYRFVYCEHPILDLLFGRVFWRRSRNRWRAFALRGHFDVWPFLRRSDLKEALRRPTFLCGPSTQALA